MSGDASFESSLPFLSNNIERLLAQGTGFVETLGHVVFLLCIHLLLIELDALKLKFRNLVDELGQVVKVGEVDVVVIFRVIPILLWCLVLCWRGALAVHRLRSVSSDIVLWLRGIILLPRNW